MYGPTCCFCPKGSGSVVLVAQHPLGPWKDTGMDLNPVNGRNEQRAISAQENDVFQVATLVNGTSSVTYLYTGDRWHSALDNLKSHDFQYWQPLVFDDTTDPPTIGKLTFMDSFQIELN